MEYLQNSQQEGCEREQFTSKRVVIKIGSSTITGGGELPDGQFIHDIASQIAVLKQNQIEVCIVSSGAVASGRRFVTNYDPGRLDHRQLAASIGQPILMSYWSRHFAQYNMIPAQILVTDQTLKQAHDLLRHLQPHHIPIINANDAISDFEMRQWMKISGDNDTLAGQIAQEIEADTVFLLTDVEGIRDANGDTVCHIDPQMTLHNVVFNGNSLLGTGGMESKHTVATHLANYGIRTIIGLGRGQNILVRGAKGDIVGTTYSTEYISSK